MKAQISVVVNGDKRQIDSESTLLSLLQALDLDPQMVVVELNRTIVKRPELGGTFLEDGDEVELVHFVGGG